MRAAPTEPVRILPAVVYDTLEFSALVYGGIGAPCVFEYEDDQETCPVCLLGHGLWATAADDGEMLDNPIAREFRFLGDSPGPASDRAVFTINRRKRKRPAARVSWADYCAELKIVRGR